MLSLRSSRSFRTITTLCSRQKYPPVLYVGRISKTPMAVYASDRWKTPEQIIPLRLLHSTSFTSCKDDGSKRSTTSDDDSVEFVGEIGDVVAKDISNATEGHLSDPPKGHPQSFTDVPGTTNTKAKTLAIIFTCKVCNTRSAKQFTEHAYRHGVVLVRCPGCENLHLIADRLGMFEDRGDDGEGWDVQKALANAGENVTAVSHDNILELTLDHIVGTNDS